MRNIVGKIRQLINLTNTISMYPYQPLYTLKWNISEVEDDKNENTITVGFLINVCDNKSNQTTEKNVFTITIHEDSVLNDILRQICDNIKKLDRPFETTLNYTCDRNVLYDNLYNNIKNELMKYDYNMV